MVGLDYDIANLWEACNDGTRLCNFGTYGTKELRYHNETIIYSSTFELIVTKFIVNVGLMVLDRQCFECFLCSQNRISRCSLAGIFRGPVLFAPKLLK